MSIKDSVVSWFINRILIPKIEIIDHPGFIITSFSEKTRETYLRDMFLEERLFSLIEKKIVKEYGDKGRKALYSAGKKFGYIYASLSNFPQLDGNKNDFLNFCYFLVRYVTSINAVEASHEIDLERKRFTIEFDGYSICRENGLGYIMTSGGIAGIWSYLVKDKTVEGIEVKCQGRGDKNCFLIVQPLKEFKKDKLVPFTETDLDKLTFTKDYKKLNQIRKTKFAKNSLKTLLNAHIFKYSKGFLTYKDLRYFYCESHVLYYLEKELSKLPGGEKILFDACFEFGGFLQKQSKEKSYKKFITDYFSALGWGDVVVIEKEKLTIASVYYPWSIYSKDSNYTIFRGVISGFISACLKKKVKFSKVRKTIRDYLTVEIHEGS